jgi:hypothetical protein
LGGHGIGWASEDRSVMDISFDLYLSAPSSSFPFSAVEVGVFTVWGEGVSGTDWEIAIRD